MNEYLAIDQHPKEAEILIEGGGGGKGKRGYSPSSIEMRAGLWTATLKYILPLP